MRCYLVSLFLDARFLLDLSLAALDGAILLVLRISFLYYKIK